MTDDNNNIPDDQVVKALAGFSPHERFTKLGFEPKHPVALFNSLSGCVIEVVESSRMKSWQSDKTFGGALWVDLGKVTGATLSNVTRVGHSKNSRTRTRKWESDLLLKTIDTDGDGTIDPAELLDFLKTSPLLQGDERIQKVIDESAGKTFNELRKELIPCKPKLKAAALESKEAGEIEDLRSIMKDREASTEFAKHMQLSNGWKDPPGIKVRPQKGLKAVESLVFNDPAGTLAKLGAALMIGVTSQLRGIGYEEGKNLRSYNYDWRTPCTKIEERDNYFSKTMDDMEDLVATNGGRKIVVVTHSLGGVQAFYFFTWVAHSDYGKQKGGVNWLKRHIHSFVPIGGPMLGTPYGSHSFLTGDEGQGLAPTVFSFADRHLVIRSWGMFGMIFPTGKHLMLQPTNSVHWVRREGLLNVHVLTIQVAKDEKDEDTVSFDEELSARSYYLELDFTSPGQHKVTRRLRTSTAKLRTDGAYDEHFQCSWCSTPQLIDGARLTVKVVQGKFKVLDKAKGNLKNYVDLGQDIIKNPEVAKGEYELGCRAVISQEKEFLTGLQPNEWCKYELPLTPQNNSGLKIVATVRLLFRPFSDTDLYKDFSRKVEEDPGAFRCGGPADNCSTKEKRDRLIETLGEAEGKEWVPKVGKLGGILGKTEKQKAYEEATWAPMNIDQVMVLDDMAHEYKWWKECYADDPIWRNYSTGSPDGISRSRPIYGINVPTVIGNVFRRQTKHFNRDEATTSLKLDKHCISSHPCYEMKGGVVQEMPKKTPQADDPTVPIEQMTFGTRASGDGTVAYWSLRWPVTWRSNGIDVQPVEVEGADHRDILDTVECQEAVLSECCSHPSKYVEVMIEGLTVTGKFLPKRTFMKAIGKIKSVGCINDSIFVNIAWRNHDYTTETLPIRKCTSDNTNELFRKCRFVFSVTESDIVNDQAIEICVKRPVQALIPKGNVMGDTKIITVKMSELMNDAHNGTLNKLAFDADAEVTMQWKWRWYSVCQYSGMPNFKEPIT